MPNKLDDYFKQENKLPYAHSLPDAHVIGKDLPSPATGITADVGNTGYEGVSPVVARADHSHGGLPSTLLSWTPNATQGVGLSISGNNSKYVTLHGMVISWGAFAINSAGTAGSLLTVDVNIALAASHPLCIGSFYYLDSGLELVVGSVLFYSTSKIQFATDGNINYLGLTRLPGGAAVGDTMNFCISYMTA